MQHALWKPMSVGRIIDRGFQLYRSYFGKLMLIMLITYGPFFLASELMTRRVSKGAGSLLGTIAKGGSPQDFFSDYLQQNPAAFDTVNGLLYLLLVLPIGAYVLFPIALGAVVGLVHRHVHAVEVPPAWELVKNALRRLGPMARSTFLFSLMLLGIYAVAAAGIIGLSVALFAGAGRATAMTAVLGMVLFFFILAVAGITVWLMIRWGYSLPFVAMKEEGIGFRRSWQLTKRNFWRMFLLFFILTAIMYTISAVLQLMLIGVIGMGVFGKLIQALVSMLVMPLYLLPYAVSFFDLRARNEGYGLEELIRRTIGDNGGGEDGGDSDGNGGYGGQAVPVAPYDSSPAPAAEAVDGAGSPVRPEEWKHRDDESER